VWFRKNRLQKEAPKLKKGTARKKGVKKKTGKNGEMVNACGKIKKKRGDSAYRRGVEKSTRVRWLKGRTF